MDDIEDWITEVAEDIAPAPDIATPRSRVRHAIARDVGDTPTLLGITSDAATLSLMALMAHTKALSETSDFDGYKTRYLELINDLGGASDPVALSSGLVDDAIDGSLKFPALLKGWAEVCGDVRASGTIVAGHVAALRQAQAGSPD
jgi:hypothetical protein